MLQKLWNLVGVLFHVCTSSGKNLGTISWVLSKLWCCHVTLGDTWMNFNNFFVCAMLMKFYRECHGNLRLLRKILFLLFDTFLYELLIMQKKIAFLDCAFCVGSFCE
jgi:hypothetical protein